MDASDNFTTRFAINRSCIKNGKPLVSGAAIRMEGQVAVFNSQDPQSPCYQCLYSEGDDDDASCSHNGVMAPLVGIIGSVQAMETIKVITDIGRNLAGRLLLLDAATMQWREMEAAPRRVVPGLWEVSLKHRNPLILDNAWGKSLLCAALHYCCYNRR